MKKNIKYLIVLLFIVSNNIYSQEEFKVVTGKVYSLDTDGSIQNVTVALFDQNQKVVAESPVNTQGLYFFELEGIDDSYRVRASAEGYTTAEVTLKFPSGSRTSRINFGLNKIQKGSDLSTVLNLDPIYFDFNSSYLNKSNMDGLERIIAVLKANPKMKIEVRAHADSRGSSKYNDWLSQRRAQRTVDWIIKHGKIESNRVFAKEYGKDKPVNDCKGANCSENKHRENRRCEFIVL